MLEFRRITLNDTNLLRSYFEKNTSKINDFTVGSILMWRDFFSSSLCVDNGALFLKFALPYFGGRAAFSVPFGIEPDAGLEIIAQYCKYTGSAMTLFSVSDENLPFVKGKFGCAKIHYNRDWADYIYQAIDLAFLKGKKYNGPRNHINKFRCLYPEFEYKSVTDADIPEIKKFLDEFYEENKYTGYLAAEEKLKTIEAAKNLKRYNMRGGIIKVCGRIIAFTAGEIISGTLFVHIEKANRSFPGAYQTIMNCFAEECLAAGVLFINREEDLGNLGMRKSKLSYRPIKLIDKYLMEI